MENQHKHIKGYRDLSQEEIDLMNRGKDLAVQVGAYVDELMNTHTTDKRWVSIGKTDAQIAFMALIRSIARPETF